jgi:hypothetical protein
VVNLKLDSVLEVLSDGHFKNGILPIEVISHKELQKSHTMYSIFLLLKRMGAF